MHKFLKKRTVRIVIIVFTCLLSNLIVAQEIRKSDVTKVIEGKKYYLHTVEKGQTLYSIARTYNQKVNDIIVDNPDAIDGIHPGDILKIALKIEYKAIHTVQAGETLYSIAKLYGLSVDQLKQLNPGIIEELKVGQEVQIGLDKKSNVKTLSNKELDKKKSPINVLKSDSTRLNSNPIVTKKRNIDSKIIYNIALLLPFNLDLSSDSSSFEDLSADNEMPYKSEFAVSFLQGVKIAVDSFCNNNKIKYHFYVYDITEKDSLKLHTLLNEPIMKNMDIIICPLNFSLLSPIIQMAKKANILCCIPSTIQNKILFNNPNTSKLVPSLLTQLEVESDYIVDNYKKQNIIIVNSGNVKDAPLVKNMVHNIDSHRQLNTEQDSIKQVKGFSGLLSAISSNKNNVIIVPSNNKTFVTDLITKIHPIRNKYSIKLFGMQSWNDFENIDIEYFNSLELYYPTSQFIDFETERVRKFCLAYFDTYKINPNPSVLVGYDVMSYYFQLINKFGDNFVNNLSNFKYNGIQMKINLHQVTDDSGFENKSAYIIKYSDYRLSKIL